MAKFQAVWSQNRKQKCETEASRNFCAFYSICPMSSASARDEVLVDITEDKIVDFTQQMRNEKETRGTVSIVDVDLSKPLRCQHFSLIEMILKNPLQEFVSTGKPEVLVASHGTSKTFFFFYSHLTRSLYRCTILLTSV
mgnify:CR=1 FL=1